MAEVEFNGWFPTFPVPNAYRPVKVRRNESVASSNFAILREIIKRSTTLDQVKEELNVLLRDGTIIYRMDARKEDLCKSAYELLRVLDDNSKLCRNCVHGAFHELSPLGMCIKAEFTYEELT